MLANYKTLYCSNTPENIYIIAYLFKQRFNISIKFLSSLLNYDAIETIALACSFRVIKVS